MSQRIDIAAVSQFCADVIPRGALGGTLYRNTVRKIGKYRNTALKMDEIPIPLL